MHPNLMPTLDKLGLTVESKFVPWSQSRNREEKDPTLNWKVTIKRNDKALFTTDYSQGIGHHPQYKQQWGKRDSILENALRASAEDGKTFRMSWANTRIPDKLLKGPKREDVLYSLVMDTNSILSAGGFEYWAGEFGYDVDSIKAEKLYKECSEIALKMTAALGTDTVELLSELFEDY